MLNWTLVAGICIVLVAVVKGTHDGPDCPRHRGLPEGFSRTENRYRDRALFRLDLRSAIKGYIPGKEYKFRVQTTYRKLKFNDATMSIDAVDESCGSGSWVTDSDDLYSPKDCPSIVTTQQKEPMGRAHFKWLAPSCGCVHFRVRVHANSTYYIDSETERIGPLARTICPKAGTVTTEAMTEPVTTEPTSTPLMPFEMTRLERLELLCEVTKSNKAADVMKNEDFITRRTMSNLNSFELERLHIAIEQRHLNILSCCNLDGDFKKSECFGDIRRIHIDTFCGNGEPDIPLTDTRYDWIKQKQPECCPQIGEDRYICFNHTLHEDEMLGDSHGQHASINMDDFDPVHFVEDYPRASDIKSKLSKKTADEKPSFKNAEYAKATDEMNFKQKHYDKKTEDHGSQARDIDDDKVDRDDDDDDYDDDIVEPDEDDKELDESAEDKEKETLKSKSFNSEECCMNGIDAGTRVIAEGFDGCFKMADKYHSFFTNWSRQCDRHFVVCCMRVIDGDIPEVRNSINLESILLPRMHACSQTDFTKSSLKHLAPNAPNNVFKTNLKKEKHKAKLLNLKQANEILKLKEANGNRVKTNRHLRKFNKSTFRLGSKRRAFQHKNSNVKSNSLKRTNQRKEKDQNSLMDLPLW